MKSIKVRAERPLEHATAPHWAHIKWDRVGNLNKAHVLNFGHSMNNNDVCRNWSDFEYL